MVKPAATPSKPTENRGLEWEFEDDAAPDRVPAGTTQKFFRLMLDHPGLAAAGGLLVVIGTAASLVEPRLLGYAIDDAIIPKNGARLIQLTVVLFVLAAVRLGAQAGQSYLFEALGQAVIHDLRMRVFGRFQNLALAVHDTTPSGRLLTRVTNDTAAIAEVFSSGLVTIVGNVLLVAGIIVWLIVLDWRLGLVTTSVFPLMLFASIRFSGRLRSAYRAARSRLSALNAFLAENLMGMKVVQLFNRQRLHQARFSRLNRSYSEAQIETIRTYALFQPTITLAAGISMSLLIVYGGTSALSGRINIGVLVAFFAYALALFRPLRDMTDRWNVLLAGLAGAERIFSVLEWPVEVTHEEVDRGRAEPYVDIRGDIVFDHVWFAYREGLWVLKDFSLEIPSGTRLAMVGHTGSGKTSVINLLLRFYEPQRGRILLDGRDLREYDKRRLRATLGVVQQDALLFSGTVRENVTTFAPKATGVLDVVADLGLPADRRLSERGGNLSAGERQLVAFARVYASEPRIWILDEATSSMDAARESRLELALSRAAAGKTLILIAHRIATTRICTRIVVLRKGEIAEAGTHSELLQLDGLYARLLRYQQIEDRD